MDSISIHGLRFIPKKRIGDARGNVLHMIKAEDGYLDSVHELYLSTTLPGCVKAWKRHQRMVQHQCVATGEMEYVFYDDRPESPTQGQINRFVAGPDVNHGLLIIPPMVWYGFRCVSDQNSVIVNAVSITHDPDEVDRLESDAEQIPFRWAT
ncbi:MAG: dTDP-4-dehydrorhamnose 3,5-epimerase family protein [bacterium]|nr:dTDP-4-dehydrorhamnose 3,5-epimerase family protein [bacterium]